MIRCILLDGICAEDSCSVAALIETILSAFSNLERETCTLLFSGGEKHSQSFRKAIQKIEGGKTAYNKIVGQWVARFRENAVRISLSIVCGNSTSSWDPIPPAALDMPSAFQFEKRYGLTVKEHWKLFRALGPITSMMEVHKNFPTAFSLYLEGDEDLEAIFEQLRALLSGCLGKAIIHCTANVYSAAHDAPLGDVLLRLASRGCDASLARQKFLIPGKYLIANRWMLEAASALFAGQLANQIARTGNQLAIEDIRTWRKIPERELEQFFIATDPRI